MKTNSPYREARTANIDAQTLADLQTVTMYPPMVITNLYITTSTNLTPQVEGNTSIPDRGYHYFPIDYAMNSVLSNATVTAGPGTVLAAYGNVGFQFAGTTPALTFNGTASSPVYFVRYNTVQEQSTTNWETSATWQGCLGIAATGSVGCEFANWCVVAGDSLISESGSPACLLTAQNCQFCSGVISLNGQTLVSTNCLYQRVATSLTEPGSQSDANTFYNNLFWNGSLTYKHAGSGIWTFRDNLFDQTLITTNTTGKYIDNCSNNAYATNLTTMTITNLLPNHNDVFLSASPAYQIGSMGQNYYPTSETSLIHGGSQSAAAAGLYLYTVTSNNMIDGTNTVSIGYHFPALGPVITAEPTNVVTTPGSSATFSVTATSTLPLTYQWYQNGVLLAGQTSSVLSLSSVTAGSAGTYEVIVSNALGTAVSWVATLRTAQNDFYVNYWNSNAISPVNPMLAGTYAVDFDTVAHRSEVVQATTGTSMRGVTGGDDAETYNWMHLTSQGIDESFANNYYPGLTPATTLDLLKNARTNGTSLIFTVNCRGDGSNNSTTGVWYTTNLSDDNFSATLASNWVRYVNVIAQNYCWSNNLIVPYGANTNAISLSDSNLITTLKSYWTNSPTLLTNTDLNPLPKVMYWEIGNEVEAEYPTTYFATNIDFNPATNYLSRYKAIRTAMLGADSTIKIGPGFGGGFSGDNGVIGPFIADTNDHFDFLVYHPYPGEPGSTWTNNSEMIALLEGVKSWQDVCRGRIYSWVATNQPPLNVPLLATEWNGDALTTNASMAVSMWTLLADTETVLAMVQGQQTIAADYWFDDLDDDWPLLFTRFQTNLGNVFLSNSDGDNIPATYGQPGDDTSTSTNSSGSCESPFRVYSTMNTNTGAISVWMLNFNNTTNQTVNLHFPAGIASGTSFVLTNLGFPPNLTNESVGTNVFAWLTNGVAWINGSSVSMTNPPATLSVAQIILSNAPTRPLAPVITSVPSLGQPGQVITITGSNFSPNLLQNSVYFGGIRGTVTAASSNSLSVQIPYGTSGYGPLTVTVSNLTAYSTNYIDTAYFGASVSNAIILSPVATNVLSNYLSSTWTTHPLDIGYFDADGDGKGDLAFLFPGVAEISENSSTGPGSLGFLLSAPLALPTFNNPAAMAVGDLDGDGLLDWVWIADGDDELWIVRNASTPEHIFFAEGNQYLTGPSPSAVKIMDVDGDGRPDILVLNHDSGTVSVFRNLSSGPGNLTFAQKVDFSTCADPENLVVADFDGDGRPDIVVAGFTNTGGTIMILTNQCAPGTISFSSPITIGTVSDPDAIAAGDFNADGKLDLAVTSYGDGYLYVYQNNSTPGNISFTVAGTFSPGNYPRAIAISDLNGDGRPDITVVNDNSSTITVYQNVWTSGALSGGSFSGQSYPTGAGGGPTVITVGDIDGDGRPDMVVGNYGTTNMVTFQNTSQY